MKRKIVLDGSEGERKGSELGYEPWSYQREIDSSLIKVQQIYAKPSGNPEDAGLNPWYKNFFFSPSRKKSESFFYYSAHIREIMLWTTRMMCHILCFYKNAPFSPPFFFFF